MFIDSTKKSYDNVWALINAANGTVFNNVAGLILGTPVAATTPGYNTKLTVSADPHYPIFQGSQDIFYNRLGLTQSIKPVPTAINVPSRTSTKADVLAVAIAQLNLVATEVTVLEDVVVDMPSVTLVPNPNSLLYVGNQVVSLNWPKPTMQEYLAVNRLNGFAELS